MAPKFFKKSYSSVIITGLIFLVAVVIGYNLLIPKERLPVYNPTDVNPRLVDYSIQHIKKDHKIGEFKLINQNGDTITNDTYKGKIYIADFFFTRCATICPVPGVHQVGHELNVCVDVRVSNDQIGVPYRAANAAPCAQPDYRVAVTARDQQVVLTLTGKAVILDCRCRRVGVHVAGHDFAPNHVGNLYIVAIVLQVLQVQHVVAGFVFGIDRHWIERVDEVHRRIGETIAPG